MKLCPKCGSSLVEVIEGYICNECGEGVLSEEEVITVKCPTCNEEMTCISDEYYCYYCKMTVSKENAVYNNSINFDENNDFEEPDYDSMIDNGYNICLNCTYWSVSPYGAAHGMICRRGYPTTGPDDSCSDFIKSHHFASYGNEGQYQFNETKRNTSNKLYHWRNNK